MEPIQIDFTNCLASQVGEHGLTDHDLAVGENEIKTVTADLERTRGNGWERWRDLPFEPMRTEHIDAVQQLVAQHRDSTDTLIVLGIGGSALGNTALHAALNPLSWNLMHPDSRPGPKLFVLDNADPHFVGDVLAMVQQDDPGFDRTLINVISKSGETPETAAQFLIVRDMLRTARGDAFAERIVATTDPEKGTMRRICDADGYATLPVPDGVGGRFSVLSPVGLFSAAMCGIDIEQLLLGAAAMDERCSTTSIDVNPAALLAWLLTSFFKRGKPMHVLMPYANALLPLADWYRQLWAESLGKRETLDGKTVHVGPTPIKALGATDQHSQIQLYREGPNDKVIGLIRVDAFERDVPIPASVPDDELAYLAGSSLRDLLHAEQRATTYALTDSERPNYTMLLPRINASTIGQFIQLWQMTTAYAGRLLNIDAYNQPAVETGKVATFGLLGRRGYDDWRERVIAREDVRRSII